MKALRILGFLLLAYGAVMLVLLVVAKDWALSHSIVHLVSRTDRRVGNEVDGSIDMPLALISSVVVMFAGVWFAWYIPRMLRQYGMGQDGQPQR